MSNKHITHKYLTVLMFNEHPLENHQTLIPRPATHNH